MLQTEMIGRHYKCTEEHVYKKISVKGNTATVIVGITAMQNLDSKTAQFIGLPIIRRPMVIDSLFQKRSQNLAIYLQMYHPPPQDWKSWLVRATCDGE